MQNNLLWGVDLGGTKIECAVIEAKSKKVVIRSRTSTQQKKGYDHILNQIKILIDQVGEEIDDRPQRLGLGTPGTIDSATNLLKNSNTVCMNNQPVKDDLQKIMGIPVITSNDANCFALAETKMGIVRDLDIEPQVVFGIIMGTGVGGGIVINGKVLNGLHGITGEWGHNYLDENAGTCYCGKKGCVEMVISGTALQKYYSELSGEKIPLKKIFQKVKQDDNARKTLDRLHEMFGKAVANVINILDPDVIVLGGGVGNVKSLLTEGREHIYPHLFNPVLNTKIVQPRLGDSAGVFGAAMLVE